MKPSILIADRESAIRESLQFLLEEEQYATELAGSDRELLQTLERKTFDLIIADIALVERNSSVIFDRIQAGSRVILITSYEEIRLLMDLMPGGLFDYVVKPFGFDHLMEHVTRLLPHSDNPEAG